MANRPVTPSMRTPRVEGVRESVAILKEHNPRSVTATRKAMRQASEPLVRQIRSNIPSAPPLSGWTHGRYAFNGGDADRGVKIRISTGSASARKATWPLATVMQSNAGGSVFDMAGRRSRGRSPQGVHFISMLNQRYGRASRSMWRGVDEVLPEVQREMRVVLDALAAEVNRELRDR